MQTAPPQRYNRSVGNALWNAVTSARNQLDGVKIGSVTGGKYCRNGTIITTINSSSGGTGSVNGGPDGGSHLNRDRDAAGDDRKLRVVHGERGGGGGGVVAAILFLR